MDLLDTQQFSSCPEEQKSLIEDTSLEQLVYWKLELFLGHFDSHELPKNLLKTLLEHVEKPLIALVLQKTCGNKLKAADILGCNRNTLKRKLESLWH